MEITLNFDLTTLLIGTLIGLLLSGLIRVLWQQRKRLMNESPLVIRKDPPPEIWLSPAEKKALPPTIQSPPVIQLNAKDPIVEKLVNYMETEKVYRQANLTLTQFAEIVAIPKHRLSQVINEKLGCNFLEFLNQYRVQEAQEKLKDATFQHQSILEIGKQSGFNSKATFYAAFKKYTHTSPGNYRKAIAS